MKLTEGQALALSGLAAALAATSAWIVVDDIPVGRALGTPVPYALLAVTWFVALPVFVVTRRWHRDRLGRLLLLATAAAAPFIAKAITYFLYPRDLFAAALILTIGWSGALAFWALFRRLAHEELT